MSIIKPSLDAVSVFTDIEKVPVIIGFESIYYRQSDTKTFSTSNRALSYIQSSVITKDWLYISDSNNQLRIINNSTTIDITLPRGNNLSVFYVAYKIAQALKPYNMSCEFINNSFKITADSNNTLSIGTPSNNGASTLGFSTVTTSNGSTGTNGYNGSVTLNGLYTGLDNIFFWVKVSGNNIFTLTPNATNFYKGSVIVSGNFNSVTSIQYTITISTLNSNKSLSGIGNNPTFSVTSTGGDSSPSNMEIVAYDAWYEIGTKGVRIKFSDYAFGNGDSFIIDCVSPQTANGITSTAAADTVKFVVLSNDRIQLSVTTLTYTDGASPYYKLQLENGIELRFENNLTKLFTTGDTFLVQAYMDIHSDVYTVDLGITGAGEESVVHGLRVIAKEGIYKINTCKIGISNPGPLLQQGIGKTEYRVGVLGKIQSKLSNEIITTNVAADVISQFYSYVSYLDTDVYITLQTGNPIFATDAFYLVLKPDEAEITQSFLGNMKVYFNYK